jgi:hypothetical protein
MAFCYWMKNVEIGIVSTLQLRIIWIKNQNIKV